MLRRILAAGLVGLLALCDAALPAKAASLQVAPVRQRYTRLGERDWRFESLETGYDVELEVDEHGLVLDYPDEFRRL